MRMATIITNLFADNEGKKYTRMFMLKCTKLKSLFWMILFILLVFSASVQAQSITLLQTVENSVQDRPVAGALVEVLYNGQVIASGHTNADGLAEIIFTPTSTETTPELPQSVRLIAYPNPAVNTLTVEMENPQTQSVTLSAYSLLGQLIGSTTQSLSPGIYRTTLSLGTMATQPVLLVMHSPSGSYSAMVTYTGNRGSVSIPTPQFSQPQTTQTETSQQAQLQAVFYTITITKAGYEYNSSVVGISDNQQHINLNTTINPKNPVLDTSYFSFGGDQGAQVCYDSGVLEDLVDGQSIDNIPFSVTAASQSPNLSLTQSLDEICFVSQAPGDHPFTVTATSAVGGETTAQYHFETTPTTTVRVENSDSRDVPLGNIAYLVVGADSLFSSSGVFEGIPVGSTVKAGFKNAVGQYTSFVRTAAVELDNSVLAQGSEPGFYVRPFDFYLRDENYVVVDSLSRTGGQLVENVVGFRNWIDVYWVQNNGNGVTRWNINPNIGDSDPNTFNFFTQSENGRGPESLIIPDIFYIENTGVSNYLDEHVKNLMIHTVENHIFPYMGFNGVFAPPIVQPDSISFLATNNQYKNHMILAPRNNFPPGVVGSIAVYGEAPNNIYSTSARIKSPLVGMSDNPWICAISQEMMAAAIMNPIPANPASLPEALATANQSILHNSTNLITPSIYDIKLLRFVWEPTYVGAVTDVIELPPGTNQNAMYQTPSGIQLINPLETNESGEQIRYRQPILDSTGKPIQSQQENNTQETSYNNIQLINPLRKYDDDKGNKTYETAILDSTGKPYAKTSIPIGTDLTDKLEAVHEQRASNRTTPKIALVPFTYKTQDANGKEQEQQAYFTLAA